MILTLRQVVEVFGYLLGLIPIDQSDVYSHSNDPSEWQVSQTILFRRMLLSVAGYRAV